MATETAIMPSQAKMLQKDALDWLSSDKVTDIVSDLNDGLGASGSDRSMLPTLIMELVEGSISIDELRRGLEDRFKPTAEMLSGIVDRINSDILGPITINSQQHLADHDAEAKEQLHSTAQRATITTEPANAPNNNTAPEVSTPFILHRNEEEGLEPMAEVTQISNSPLRPVFYKPTDVKTNAESDNSSRFIPVKARLELGTQQEWKPKDKLTPTLQTNSQDVRRVNYSELRTNLNDPFATGTNTSRNRTVGDKQLQDKKDEGAKKVGLEDLPL